MSVELEQVDPELVETAVEFTNALLAQTAEHLGRPLYEGPWNALSARRVLEDDEELVVLVRADRPITALAAAGWRYVVEVGHALALRGRRVDGAWTIVGLEDVADHLDALPPP